MPLVDLILRTGIFVDVMYPDLLVCTKRSVGLYSNVVITNPHPITHPTIRDEAYRFRRFIVDDMKPSPIRGDAFPSVASHPKEVIHLTSSSR